MNSFWQREANIFSVRIAQEADLPAIVDLACQFKMESQTHSPVFDELRADHRSILTIQLKGYLESQDSRILVALPQASPPIGFCVGYIWQYLPIYKIQAMGYLAELFVLPASRQQGVGHALVLEMEAWFRKRGAQYARLESIKHYANNRAFYENLGYEVFIYDMRKAL